MPNSVRKFRRLKILTFDFDGIFPKGNRFYPYEESLFKAINKFSGRGLKREEIYKMFDDFIKHDLTKREKHESGKLAPFLKNFFRQKGLAETIAARVALEMLLDKKTIYSLKHKIEPVFQFLIAKELKIALVSDSIFPTIMRRILLQHWGLLQYFDLVLTSQEHKRKSGLSIFKKVQSFFRVRPGEIMHIGDTLENDVFPAKKAGLRTCLLSSVKVNLDTVPKKFQPDFTIKRLGDIRNIIEKGASNHH